MDLTDARCVSSRLEAYSSRGQQSQRDHHETEQTFNDVFHAPTTQGRGESPTTQEPEGSHREKRKRTPPDVEAALRRYNREGITKWDVILERLKSETPSIVIKRSTLGEYLKECNIGGARRKNMGEDEMRRLVLQELNQPMSRKRGVRKVWEALKSKGHHIKREFVERVMKDVDPNGFVERRPKWKPGIITGLPDAAGQPSLPLPGSSAPSTSPPRHAHVTAPPLTMDQSTETSVGMAAQPMSQFLPSRNTNSVLNAQLLDFDMFQPEGFAGDDLPLSTSVPPDIRRWGMDNDVGEDWNMDGGSSRLLNSGTLGTIGPTPVVTHVRDDILMIHSSLNASHEDAPSFDNREIDRVQQSPSGNPGTTRTASGSSPAVLVSFQPGTDTSNVSGGAPVASLIPSTDGLTGSSRTEGRPDRQFLKTILLQLKNTLKDLWNRLDDWCAAPLGHPDTGPSRPAQFPNSHTRGTSIDPSPCGPHDATQTSGCYIPDYNVPEEEVTTEALLLVLTLTRTLSPPTSRRSIVVVADQLRQLGGMLRDIGMPMEVLEAVSERRLEVAEMTAGAFGDEEWVLHDLWQCAADYVWELHICSIARKVAATEAANAARQLISISSKHTDFYRACSLHYDTISSDAYLRNKEAHDKVTQAVNLFQDTVSSTFSSEHVEEMMRAMRSQSISKHYSSDDMKVVYDQTLANPSDPTWAMLCAEIGQNKMLDDDSLEMALHLVSLQTHAIKVLRSCQHARPTRVEHLLVCVFEARGRCLFAMDCCLEAIQDLKEAIYIQTRVAKSSQEDDYLFNLGWSVRNCLKHDLRGKRWEDALGTMKRVLEIAESDSEVKSEILNSGLIAFRSHLKDSRDLAALSATRELVDSLRPLLGSNQSGEVLSEWVYTLVTISNIHREFGDFQAALDTSREAVAIARELRSRDSEDTDSFIEALACHARSLGDGDAYDDATALLQEAITSSDKSHRAHYLGLFGVAHAHAAVPGSSSNIDEAISASHTSTDDFALPLWLSGRMIYLNDDVKRAWLLFIRSVMECTTSPSKAQATAKESLTLMSQYYERTQADMKPYAKASVFGHKYILLSILGDQEQGQSVLNQSNTLFRRVLDDDPRMARLPLIVFLDILLVLFRPLSLRFEMTTLQRWKKSVYDGSTAFFGDFVAFLEGLPRHTHPRS